MSPRVAMLGLDAMGLRITSHLAQQHAVLDDVVTSPSAADPDSVAVHAAADAGVLMHAADVTNFRLAQAGRRRRRVPQA